MTIERAFASANDTLDQAADTLLDSMTITPPSGEYLAVFSGHLLTASTAQNNALNTFSIYVGGSQVAGSEVVYQEDSSVDNTSVPMAVSIEVNPNGSQAVELRYRRSSATNPSVFQRRELLLFPMSGGFEDTGTSVESISSSTWATLAGMTRTPPADDYLLIFTASTEATSGEIAGFRVSVGGTPIAASEIHFEAESSWAGQWYPVMCIASISPSGSEVVEIEWNSQTNVASASCDDRSMNLMPVDSGDIFLASGTVADADSTITDNLIDDMTITDPGADTYMVLLASYDVVGAPDNNSIETEYHFHQGGNHEADTIRIQEHEGSIDNADIPVLAAGRVTLSAGTDDIEGFWQNPASTITRTLQTRQMIAVREGAAGPPALPTEIIEVEQAINRAGAF